MSNTSIKKLQEVLIQGEALPDENWQIRVISSGDCQSYLVWNCQTGEGLVIDPKLDDLESYLQFQKELKEVTWLGVIDTHTHADHISAAAQLSGTFQAPLIMHHRAPSSRVHIRIARSTQLPARAGGIHLILTPGHTPDGMCVLWGPFLFAGDTVMFADVGRDDLPGGDPAAHYDSVQQVSKSVDPSTLVLPGHDHKGGRVSSWATQLKVNASLTQPKEVFIQECSAFETTAPALLKKSLFENMK